MSTPYAVINRAANHIDRFPGLYSYDATWIPPVGVAACALGWIGAFAQLPIGHPRGIALVAHSDSPQSYVVPSYLCVGQLQFYASMDQLGSAKWRHDAFVCACALRRYASIHYGSAEIKTKPRRHNLTIAAAVRGRV